MGYLKRGNQLCPSQVQHQRVDITNAVPGLKDLNMFSSKQLYKLINAPKYDIENVKDL